MSQPVVCCYCIAVAIVSSSRSSLSVFLPTPLYSGAVFASERAMKLETEFRLCLQRQTLERAWHTTPDRFAVQPSELLTPPAIAPSTWVKLLQPPSAYCSDEALLLCQTADNQWLAWIPDYGEIVLKREQFTPLFE